MEQKGKWPGPATTVDFTLWRILDHARFMISRSREMELTRLGMTPEQSHVLDILNESGGSTTINELVDITQRQHHSISTLIDRMHKQKLVTKRKSGTDRRQYEVVITQKGEHLVKNMTRESISAIFACLNKEEMELLKSYLIRLTGEAYRMIKKED
jgi:DNA-binding MarR family transcriptional regulator